MITQRFCDNNLDQDRTSKRGTCVCCCIFSTRSLVYLLMGTHDRVWSRHTHTTKGNSFPCDLVWIIPHFLTVFTFPAHLPLQPELEALCWARCPPPLMKPYPAYPSCCWGMVTLRLAPAPWLLGSWSASPPVTHSIISFTTLLERSAAVSPLHHHTALYNTVSP